MLKKYKTQILLIILGVVILVFVGLVIKNMMSLSSDTEMMEEEAMMEEKTNSIAVGFEPPVLDISETTNEIHAVDIVADSLEPGVAGFEFELEYDSDMITDVVVLPAEGGFLGDGSTMLFNEVDEEEGMVSYAVAISPTDESTNETGTIATVTFVKNQATQAESTVINFTKILTSTHDGTSTEIVAAPLLISL